MILTRTHVAAGIAGAILSAAAVGAAVAEVSNFQGHASTRAEACAEAKRAAEGRLAYMSARLDRFGPCDCSEDREMDSGSVWRWTCSVDAYYSR